MVYPLSFTEILRRGKELDVPRCNSRMKIWYYQHHVQALHWLRLGSLAAACIAMLSDDVTGSIPAVQEPGPARRSLLQVVQEENQPQPHQHHRASYGFCTSHGLIKVLLNTLSQSLTPQSLPNVAMESMLEWSISLGPALLRISIRKLPAINITNVVVRRWTDDVSLDNDFELGVLCLPSSSTSTSNHSKSFEYLFFRYQFMFCFDGSSSVRKRVGRKSIQIPFWS